MDLTNYNVFKEKNAIKLEKDEEGNIRCIVSQFDPLTGQPLEPVVTIVVLSELPSIEKNIADKISNLLQAKDNLQVFKEDIENI